LKSRPGAPDSPPMLFARLRRRVRVLIAPLVAAVVVALASASVAASAMPSDHLPGPYGTRPCMQETSGPGIHHATGKLAKHTCAGLCCAMCFVATPAPAAAWRTAPRATPAGSRADRIRPRRLDPADPPPRIVA
jgi:hypothetical protein